MKPSKLTRILFKKIEERIHDMDENSKTLNYIRIFSTMVLPQQQNCPVCWNVNICGDHLDGEIQYTLALEIF